MLESERTEQAIARWKRRIQIAGWIAWFIGAMVVCSLAWILAMIRTHR